ncbi:MAG TPA: NUDIX hydrolase [Chloroflexia bacterium]|jgi:ADP-ribose pyrophosphatase YjhB (NUDIX family)
MSYDNVLPQESWAHFRVGQGVLVEGGRVLLSGNRWYTGKPLVWTLPGGRAEDGEGVGEATAREFLEETGLHVEVGELAFVVEARSLTNRRLFLTCAFRVRLLSGTLTTGSDPAVEDLRFVPAEELPLYLPSPSLGDPLRHYLAHQDESPRYWFFPEYSPT